jgi:hypothetical protein
MRSPMSSSPSPSFSVDLGAQIVTA